MWASGEPQDLGLSHPFMELSSDCHYTSLVVAIPKKERSCNDCSFEKPYCQHRSGAEDLARSKNHEPRRGSRRLPQEARHEGEERAAYLKALFELHKGEIRSCKVWEETERGWVMNIRAWSLPWLLDLFGDTFSAEPIYEMYIASEVTRPASEASRWRQCECGDKM